MAESICESFQSTAKRLMDLGLGYLSLDRAAVHALHRRAAADAAGPRRAQPHDRRAVCAGRAVHRSAPVEHRRADRRDARPRLRTETPSSSWTTTRRFLQKRTGSIEMGPEAGAKRRPCHRRRGPIADDRQKPRSRRSGRSSPERRTRNCASGRGDRRSCLPTETSIFPPEPIHTVKPLEVRYPEGAADRRHRRIRLRQDDAGSGKPRSRRWKPHDHGERRCRNTSAPSRRRASAQVKLIDATPIGINVRSTVATYANVHDELRKIYRAEPPDAKERLAIRPGDFSYNTGDLRCPGMRRNGRRSVWTCSSCPDVEIPCPDCRGSRYARERGRCTATRIRPGQPISLPELMDMDVNTALEACRDMKTRPPAAAGARQTWVLAI